MGQNGKNRGLPFLSYRHDHSLLSSPLADLRDACATTLPLGTLAGHSANNFLGPVTGGIKRPLWYSPYLSATSLPIELLSNQALAGESLQNPSLSSPNPTPAQEESCLEGPHGNAKEVAMETQAGWCAAQRGKVPSVSRQAEEGAGAPE